MGCGLFFLMSCLQPEKAQGGSALAERSAVLLVKHHHPPAPMLFSLELGMFS